MRSELTQNFILSFSFSVVVLALVCSKFSLQIFAVSVGPLRRAHSKKGAVSFWPIFTLSWLVSYWLSFSAFYPGYPWTGLRLGFFQPIRARHWFAAYIFLFFKPKSSLLSWPRLGEPPRSPSHSFLPYRLSRFVSETASNLFLISLLFYRTLVDQ